VALISFEQIPIGGRFHRKQLAELWGYRSFEAISRGVVTPAGQNCIVLFVEREKEPGRSTYVDFISGDQLFWEGELGHGNDARITQAQKNGVEIHLFYRDLHREPFEYKGPVLVTQFELRESAPSRFVFRIIHDLSALDDIQVHSHELSELSFTEREVVTMARLGQGEFRKRLIEFWTGECAVTGLPFPEAMRASHIKPWRDSSNKERLNPHNGLLLLPQYDHLFDRGYITFGVSGRIRLSPVLAEYDLNKLGIREDASLRFVREEHVPYLVFHENTIFRE
jgi:putative restriction endonuclease